MFPSLRRPLNILSNDLEDRLEYLGPVRADPRPFYPIDDDPDIGLRGEGVIPYLLQHQRDVVEYVREPSEELLQEPLLEAINAWLRRMNVTTRLTIDPLEAIAYTAAIQSRAAPGKSVNLAQVGFGISQLLPVLVAGLKNPSDAWLLLEQPDVHAGTDDNPSSYVEPLQVDESGTIINCPPDFFSEAPDEAFAILQAQRRKAKKAAP
jgi:predicted ATPase